MGVALPGRPVSSPVWLARAEGGALFNTRDTCVSKVACLGYTCFFVLQKWVVRLLISVF